MPQNCILVCVTDQPQCSRLIRRGRELADEKDARLLVLHVRTRQKTLMGNPDIPAAINQLYAEARAADAEMEIISSQDVEKTICDYAKSRLASQLVIGVSPIDGHLSMKERLSSVLPDMEITTVHDG